MRTIAIDFETYYDKDYTLKKLATLDYVRDPKFNPYMVSIVGDGLSWVGNPREFDWSLISNALWVSHNAYFDAMVYQEMVYRGWLPEVYPVRWCCTAGASRYYQGPASLQMAAKFWLGEEVDKTVRDRMQGNVTNSQENLDYALKDSELCLKLWEHLRLPEREQWLQDLQMWRGIMGVHIDVPLLNAGKKKLELALHKAKDAIPWEGKAGSKKLLNAECKKLGIPAPITTRADSEEYEEWLDAYEEKAPFVKSINDFRVGNKNLKLLETMGRNLDNEGRRAFELVYYGATATGRYSGGSKFNLQNLAKKPRFDVNVRHLLIPPPGYKFINWDLSQIEPRISAFVIGDTEFLDLVRAGSDTYEAHARGTMGYDGPRPLEEVDPELRNLAKVRVLGLFYGAGYKAFMRVAAQYGVYLDEGPAKVEVNRFRKSNPLLTRAWEMLEREAKSCIGGDFQLQLPSGRIITYRSLHYEGRKIKCTIDGGKTWRAFWGSKWFENLIQATAGDAFKEKLYLVEQAGIPVLWTVHDEAICIVPTEEAEACAAKIKEIVSQPISWLGDCPLACKVKITDRYEK